MLNWRNSGTDRARSINKTPNKLTDLWRLCGWAFHINYEPRSRYALAWVAFSLRGLRDLRRIQLKKSPLPKPTFAHIVFALGGHNTGKFQLNCDFIMKIFFESASNVAIWLFSCQLLILLQISWVDLRGTQLRLHFAETVINLLSDGYSRTE